MKKMEKKGWIYVALIIGFFLLGVGGLVACSKSIAGPFGLLGFFVAGVAGAVYAVRVSRMHRAYEDVEEEDLLGLDYKQISRYLGETTPPDNNGVCKWTADHAGKQGISVIVHFDENGMCKSARINK